MKRIRKPGEPAPSPATVFWTMAAFLASAAPHLAAMSAVLVAATLAGPAWRLAALLKGWKPPPMLIRLPLTLAAVALVLVEYGSLWGRRAATTLLCIMLSAKMLELFRLRDMRMVASVAFFLIATQFLFSERLIYLAYLAVGCWIATLALVHVQRDAERPAGEKPATPGFLKPVRDSGAILLMALPFALALFVLFPRLAQPLWGLPEHVMDARTGLSDSMSPGAIAELYADESPAFRVEFEGGPPPPEERYWRGPVLWNYDGDTWRRFFFSDVVDPPVPEAGPGRYTYRVQLEPNEQRWLFTLDYPARWSEEANLTLDYQLVRENPVTTALRYDVISEPEFRDAPEELAAHFRHGAVNLPDDRNPRTIEQAREWREEFPDDRELIDHILNWFNTEPFYYSLDPGPLGRHGMDEFLFELRNGFCEYYASAFAVLMRAADIPARVVTGYQGGLWQPAGEYLLVRQSDAHAWVEVWLEGSGWTRVDPTAAVAPSRIQAGGARSVAPSRGYIDWPAIRAIRDRYDIAQHYWNRWVLGFDAQRQDRMMAFLGLPGLSSTILAVFMLVVASILMAVVLLIHWRQPGGRPDEATRQWRKLLGKLRRHGLNHEVGETPLEFADRAAQVVPERAREILQLARLYCRVHYGREGPEELDSLREGVRQFRRRPE